MTRTYLRSEPSALSGLSTNRGTSASRRSLLPPFRSALTCLAFLLLAGCASIDRNPVPAGVDSDAVSSLPMTGEAEQAAANNAGQSAQLDQRSTARIGQPVSPLRIDSPQRTGFLESPELGEISGLASSQSTPGVLFGINDSGNPPILYAFSETGRHLGQWSVAAPNRDWEDMATARIGGKDYLILGDTGDNLQVHRESTLYFIEEPGIDTARDSLLRPSWILRFRYEDGPRNVEAFAVAGNSVYLISKEPVLPGGAQPSRLYRLAIPDASAETLLVAQYLGNLPLAPTTLTSRLAAAVAGVDLNHPTALDFDPSGNAAYLLTYRHVLRINRAADQSWADAFAAPGTRFYAHDLQQAEALTVVAGESLWITSENGRAPLWAVPLTPPS